MKKRGSRALALLLALALSGTAAEARDVSITTGTGIREKPEAEVQVQWDDAWFGGDAAVYRHELAKTAMALSGAAYVRTDWGAGAGDAQETQGVYPLPSYDYRLTAGSAGQTA